MYRCGQHLQHQQRKQYSDCAIMHLYVVYDSPSLTCCIEDAHPQLLVEQILNTQTNPECLRDTWAKTPGRRTPACCAACSGLAAWRQ
jgi:hypothetical protein